MKPSPWPWRLYGWLCAVYAVAILIAPAADTAFAYFLLSIMCFDKARAQ
jgi:hypothetical protein